MFFLKRQPEPAEMSKIEHAVFGDLSQENYKRWFIPLVDQILSLDTKPNKQVLDVGSGPGLLAKEIALRSKSIMVTGIDISSEALRIAQKNCKGVKNTLFKKGSVYALPFDEGCFDVVVCKDSFHHFDSPQKALIEMWRVLKVGGILYIQDLRRDVPMYLIKRSMHKKNVIQKLQYYSVRAAHTKPEIKKMILKLKPTTLTLKTRLVTKKVALKYSRIGVDRDMLKEAFQSRFVLIAKK